MKKSLIVKLLGAAVFVVGLIAEETGFADGYYLLLFFVPAYLLTGYEVLINCAHNLFCMFKNIGRHGEHDHGDCDAAAHSHGHTHGGAVNEYLLLVIVTAGAFALGEYVEAVAVMIFYQIGEIFAAYLSERSGKAIALLTGGEVSEPPAGERFITKFSRVYTPIVISAAVVAGIAVPLIFDLPLGEWFNIGLMVLLTACPCALMLGIPMCYCGAILSAKRSGILLKSALVLDLVLSDKNVVYAGDDEEQLKNAAIGITGAGAPRAVLLEADIIIKSGDLAQKEIITKIARRTRVLIIVNLIFILSAKLALALMSLSGVVDSLLLAEAADVALAVIASIIALSPLFGIGRRVAAESIV